ncbi:MAG: peptidoglycan DD-metalloendopeptidase family protein [Halieaceae bacterium]|nr:peptidoglycan DD-metalloendopeptidase family protein [Halieaceae bacterium]
MGKLSNTNRNELSKNTRSSMVLKLSNRLVLIIFFSLFEVKDLTAGESSKTQDLKELDSKILNLKSGISRIGNKRSQLLNLLEESEKKINNLNKDINEIDNKVSYTKLNIAKIRQDHIQISQKQVRLLERVKKTFRHIWLMGRRSQLQILLSNEDPIKLSRKLNFYRSLVSSEINTIESFKMGLTKSREKEKELEEAHSLLRFNRKKLDARKKTLAKLSKSRMEVVTALTKDMSNRQDQIRSLKADRARLEALLNQFKKSKVMQDQNSFSSAKGKMPWPTNGKLKNYYGMPRNDGKMSWQGITLYTEKGEKVHAIHYGQIVYSDWFRGLGLLVIIDHGEGYMSLYAHNNSVLKNLGEWVTPKMPIATVGNSGGLEKPSLYFEIRQDGIPTDPALWCTNE